MSSQSTLGKSIRSRRQDMQLTLQQLSSKSEVSRAAISKIERGDSGASTAVLGKLAEALNLSISQLIGGRQSSGVLHIPPSEQPVFREDKTGFERQSLSPLYHGRGIDFVRNRLPPKAKTGPFPSHHDGVEEHLYVTKGRLKVVLDDEEYVLETGDFLFFPADRSHSFENLTGRDCEYFIVIDSSRLK